MASTSTASVDRQATFDTDPRRAKLTRGGLKLPIIEGKDKGKDGRISKSDDNKHDQSASKDSNNVNNNKRVDEKNTKTNKVSNNQSSDTGAGIKNSSKNVSNESIPASVEATRKSDALSHVNKKVTAPSNLTKNQSKDFKNSSEKINSEKSTSDKHLENRTKASQPEQQSKGAKDRSVSKTDNPYLKSTTQTPNVNSQKPSNKTNKGHDDTSTVTRKQSINKRDVEANEDAKGFNNTQRQRASRSPEKQTAKASVLKDLNNKRSVSPAQGRHPSQQKNSNSKVNESPRNKSTSKLQENKTPRNTSSSNIKAQHQSQTKTNVTHAVAQPEKQDVAQIKELRGDNKNTKTVQKQQLKSSDKETTDKRTSESDESNRLEISKTRTLNPDSARIDIRSVPHINSPRDPRLSNDNKESKYSSGGPSIRKTNIGEIKTRETESISEDPNEFETSSVNKDQNSNKDISANESYSTLKYQSEEKYTKHSLTTNEENDVNKRTLYSNNLRVPPSGEDLGHIDDIEDKELTTNVQNKRETYVVSPSESKLNSRYPRSRDRVHFGRLSPTNETVDPIRTDHRREKGVSGMDRKESYAQVYAERNTLLQAEKTYRKRIKQLEEEANGFLAAIEELTKENKYLRSRVDALEDELRGKVDISAIDKISELERDKAELENKVKRLEKVSNEHTSSEDVRELKEQVVKLQSENQKINDENAKLKSEYNETAKKLNALNSDSKTYSKSEPEYELTAKVKRLEKKVNSLEFENKMLSETLTQKKTELSELLGVMKDENKFDDEIKELKSQVVKLTKSNKEAEQIHSKETRVLNEKIQELKSMLDSRSSENDELKIKLDEGEKEKQKMKSMSDKSKKVIDSQKEEIERLKEENKRLVGEKDEYKERYTSLVTHSESAAHELGVAKDNLEKFNKDLQKVVNDKESQISKLINQLDTMREERELLRRNAGEEKEKMLAEKEKNESHMKNIRRLETDLKHLVEKLDGAKEKEKTLTTDLEDRSNILSNLEKQVFELNMKMESNSKRMHELDREKRDMEKEKREWDVKKDKIDDIEASNKRLMEENKRLRSQLELTTTNNQPDPGLSDRSGESNKVVEAWVNIKEIPANSKAIYVQKEPSKHRLKRVELVQPSSEKKRQPFSKSSPVKHSKHPRNHDPKSSQNTHRSMEDLRKVVSTRTPESESSLPELTHDARLTGFGGYREIHKNRIRAAHKRVY